MTDKKTDPLVTVINPEARIHALPYYDDEPRPEIKDGEGHVIVMARDTKRVRALPGLNFVRESELAKAGVRAGEHPVLRIGEDLARMQLLAAIKLANESSSAPALKRWLASEKRADVRNAIEKRLASRRAA